MFAALEPLRRTRPMAASSRRAWWPTGGPPSFGQQRSEPVGAPRSAQCQRQTRPHAEVCRIDQAALTRLKRHSRPETAVPPASTPQRPPSRAWTPSSWLSAGTSVCRRRRPAARGRRRGARCTPCSTPW